VKASAHRMYPYVGLIVIANINLIFFYLVPGYLNSATYSKCSLAADTLLYVLSVHSFAYGREMDKMGPVKSIPLQPKFSASRSSGVGPNFFPASTVMRCLTTGIKVNSKAHTRTGHEGPQGE
jgi:hypothetical protein